MRPTPLCRLCAPAADGQALCMATTGWFHQLVQLLVDHAPVEGRRDNGNSVGFVKSSQIVKVAILTINVFNIIVHHSHRCAAKDGCAVTDFGH